MEAFPASEPTCLARNTKSSAMPAWVAPPRTAQKSSGSVCSSTQRICPSAVSTRTRSMWSRVSPWALAKNPTPPAVASPPTPVSPKLPLEITRSCGASAPATSPQFAPACTCTRPEASSITWTRLSEPRSTTTPPALVDEPAMPWPPERTLKGTRSPVSSRTLAA